MIANRSLGLVAAAATLLAAAPLSAIFQRWTWLIQATVAVAVVAGCAALLRMLRVPLWGQVLGMVAGLSFALTWMFPSGDEFAAVLPTPTTLGHFGELIAAAATDVRSYGVKVPDTDPLLFLAVLGVGGVAVVVDLLAVGLRRPALAGLPMLAIYSVPVAVYVDSVPPVPFVIGAAGYLWLLVTDNVDRVRRFGRRFTGDGRGVDVWESSPLAAAGRRLAVVGVMVAVVVPLAVPGLSGGLLDELRSGTGTGQAGTGGGPGRVDLFATLRGELNQSEVADLVRVTTTEENPFYLRLGVADVLRPDGFRVSAPAGEVVTRGVPAPRDGVRRGVRQERHRATVEVTRNLDMRLMPTYAQPLETDGLSGNWRYDPARQIVFSSRENSRGKRYEFDYVRFRYTPEALRSAPSLPQTDRLRRELTVVPPVREVDELVAELTAGRDNDYDRVRAIYDHFSAENGFRYSLSTEGGTSGQEILDFLTNKAGFCQQYAAAMAWLVRAAGIPARVVFGFTNGTSREENTYVLTNRNLHAWTEVYFDGFGWVPFDATPAYGVPGNTRTEWAPDTDAPDPVTPSPGASAAPGDVEPSAGPAGRDEADRGLDPGVVPESGAPVEQRPVWPWWAAGVPALLALLALPALRRVALRRRRGVASAGIPLASVPADDASRDDTDPAGRMVVVETDAEQARDRAHAAWAELLDTLVDFRVRVDRTETPRATADRLVRETLTGDDQAQSAVRLLGRAEERARYARDPLTGGNLRPALGAVRQTLTARAGWRTRLVAAALPPSVLLRWRTRMFDASVRLVTATVGVRARLLRWNFRRLLGDRPS